MLTVNYIFYINSSVLFATFYNNNNLVNYKNIHRRRVPKLKKWRVSFFCLFTMGHSSEELDTFYIYEVLMKMPYISLSNNWIDIPHRNITDKQCLIKKVMY